MKNEKKFKISGIIIFIITIFLVWYVLKDNFDESLSLFLSANKMWILAAMVAYSIFILLESLISKKLINQYDKKYSFKKSVNLNIITRFFNSITPFAAGGGPLQVYELNKEGIKVSIGTIVQVERFILSQVSIVILSIVSITLNTIFGIINCDKLLYILAIVGFIINIALLLFAYTVAINKNVNNFFAYPIITFLSKIKIIKDKDKAIKKFDETCIDYKNGYFALVKNKKNVIYLLTIQLLALIVWFITPLLVFKALGYTGNISIITSIIISVYIFIVGSYIPIPGGTGGTEYAFIEYFKSHVAANMLSPALLLWRFINYYLPMIIGAILFNLTKKKR